MTNNEVVRRSVGLPEGSPSVMSHKARCCMCPWKTRAITLEAVVRHAQEHTLATGHTRIRIRDLR
jgi:hypothetical protein